MWHNLSGAGEKKLNNKLKHETQRSRQMSKVWDLQLEISTTRYTSQIAIASYNLLCILYYFITVMYSDMIQTYFCLGRSARLSVSLFDLLFKGDGNLVGVDAETPSSTGCFRAAKLNCEAPEPSVESLSSLQILALKIQKEQQTICHYHILFKLVASQQQTLWQKYDETQQRHIHFQL